MLPSHMSGGFGLIIQQSITFSRRNSKVQWQKWQPEYWGGGGGGGGVLSVAHC